MTRAIFLLYDKSGKLLDYIVWNSSKDKQGKAAEEAASDYLDLKTGAAAVTCHVVGEGQHDILQKVFCEKCGRPIPKDAPSDSLCTNCIVAMTDQYA